MRRAVLACCLLFWAFGAAAIGVDPPLPDPAQEARAREISRGLRCLVCQNQSIEDSNAPLARDLRTIVRERITAGDNDDQVRAYMVARYGDWVLLKPPVNQRTLLLWAAPAVLLVLAVGGVWLFYRRRASTAGAAAAPLSADEQARLARLLDEPGR